MNWANRPLSQHAYQEAPLAAPTKGAGELPPDPLGFFKVNGS